MLLASALVSSALFISEVLAAPRRVHSGLRNHVDNTTHTASGYTVSYGPNWAGAVLSMAEGTFNTITGTFIVPLIQGSPDSVAGVWVGLDGSSCNTAILQTGIEMQPDGNGGGIYSSWYEWWPDPAYYLDYPIIPGDIIKLSVSANSQTDGRATIENLTQGWTEEIDLTSEHALCLRDAEWIVEDPDNENGEQIPFANFGTVQFYDAVASGPAGHYTPDQANIALIATRAGRRALTSVAADAFSVTVTYIGG